MCHHCPLPTSTTTDLDEAIRAAALRVPPLWDLDNYVAVNPFMAFDAVSPADAAVALRDALDAEILPPLSFYRERWQAKAFDAADLARAAERRGVDPSLPRRVLEGCADDAVLRTDRVRTATFAERFDARHGTALAPAIVRAISDFCAVRATGGGTAWRWAADDMPVSEAWREWASSDRTLVRAFRDAGLASPTSFIAACDGSAANAIERSIDALQSAGIAIDDRSAWFHRLLGRMHGWASWMRRRTWTGAVATGGAEDPADVRGLLAVLVVCDAAVALAAGRNRLPAVERASTREDESVRLVLQDALEDRWVRGVADGLRPIAPTRSRTRPSAQAVFCIDVRSEILRRHLEADDASIETLGFAGFFGVALDWRTDGCGSPRCPVLLAPGVALDAPDATTVPGGDEWFAAAKRDLQAAPSGAFAFVEAFGLLYAADLARDAVAARGTAAPAERDERTLSFDVERIPLATRVAIAEGILANLALPTPVARIVLLCGHAGSSANNPHAAGLDCGACGGHGGALNARVAARILGDRSVRVALAERGCGLPEDVVVLAGLHDTTTDIVELLDMERVPETHRDDVLLLRSSLERASAATRRERAQRLGAIDASATAFRRRSRDWSETRPEWALARNAAFIAARRGRTRGLHLDGRSFLHEYDAERDPNDAVLTLILVAPVVVASWINLQYWASTVDHEHYGAGDKTLHNRLGQAGVVLGNGGDLRTGLPLQSVVGADGRWFHEPIRLQVMVEADPQRIDAVLAKHAHIRNLVEHGWIRLFAIERAGTLLRRIAAGAWAPIDENDERMHRESGELRPAGIA
jgi:uncharacterized protein YbcC (UPF0753/DUF2309 family)